MMKQFQYTINGQIYKVTVKKAEDTIAEVEVNGTPYKVLIDKPVEKKEKTIKRSSQVLTSKVVVPTQQQAKKISGNAVKSPLPGTILSIDCHVGDAVKKGRNLLILEAMKMENSIPADRDGVISEIKVNTGDSVSEGSDLVIIQ